MKLRHNLTFLFALIVTGNAAAQSPATDCPETFARMRESPYASGFQTRLKGGYTIRHVFNCTDQYLLFQKGGRVIDTLSGDEVSRPYPHMGYVYADFPRHFAFVLRNGIGNPVLLKVLEKATLKNVIWDFSALIDVAEKEQLVFYFEADVPAPGDDFRMLDLKTMKRRSFPFPKDIFGEPQVCNRLKLKSVRADAFVFTYTKDGVARSKTYRR